MSADTVNAGMLRAFVERIERVEEEIKTLNADKSEIYKEARGHGYDVKAIRAVVAKRKLDSAEREEREAIFDLYWSALHGGSVHVHTPARENIEEFPPHDPETGELTDTQEQPETARTEPADAAVTAGNDLREPVAAEQGQIIREGDAPRETDRVSGDASCPDTEYQVGENVQVTTAARNDAGKQGVTAGETADDGRDVEASGGAAPVITNSPSDAASSDAVADPQAPQSATATLSDDDVPAFLKKDRYVLRPHCLNPSLCAGSGREHCHACKRAMAESEVA
jgi:uncharacterized protein (UPF0335 family)